MTGFVFSFILHHYVHWFFQFCSGLCSFFLWGGGGGGGGKPVAPSVSIPVDPFIGGMSAHAQQIKSGLRDSDMGRAEAIQWSVIGQFTAVADTGSKLEEILSHGRMKDIDSSAG